MKKLLLALSALLFSATAIAGPNDLRIDQRNSLDSGTITRTLASPVSDGLLYYNATTLLPGYLTLGSNLGVVNGVLDATIPAQVNADWNASTGPARILNKPSFATLAYTGQYADLIGAPVLAPVATSGAYADLTGKPILATVATSGSYNDLSNKPTIPTVSPFNFGSPTARTLAVSTAYQATDTTKAAIVTVSPQCSATITLSNGGTCTMQARIGASGLTCSTGTVVAQWTNGNTGTLTVGLNLTQIIGGPGDIKLPIGGWFILCATAGTFTINAAVDQSAG